MRRPHDNEPDLLALLSLGICTERLLTGSYVVGNKGRESLQNPYIIYSLFPFIPPVGLGKSCESHLTHSLPAYVPNLVFRPH